MTAPVQAPAGAPALRPYQVAAIAGVEDAFARGDRATLLVLPTGCGKTVVFAEVARRYVAMGIRVLVLAHRSELLEQAANKLAAVGCHAEIERGAQRAGRWATVVVASVQSLHAKRLELDRFKPDTFGLIIVDEAHHAPAPGYQRIFAHFAGAKILGVTATADRADGKALGETFQSVAYRYDLRDAIRDGYLAKLTARRIEIESLDLTGVHTRAGDLDATELSTLITDEKVLHGIAAPLVEQAGDRPTIVFAVSVANAFALADVINRYRPGKARAVDGSADETERARILRDFKAGAFQYLINCALFTEGFDEPSIACVAMARPTKSRGLYTQCVGRGTRLHPGKVDCLILDFVGQAGRHRLIGPVDVLAGREVPEDQKAASDRLLDGEQLELEAVLEAAAANLEAERRKRKLVAVATYRTVDVDPFIGRWIAPHDASDTRAPTPAQLAAVKSAGLGDPPDGVSRSEVSAILDAVAQRRRDGLASIPQAKLLRKYGITTPDLTFQRAGELIAIVKAGNWRPGSLIGQPEFRGQPQLRRGI